MRAVVQRTGLSAHVIRVWERRYSAVAPARTPKNQRLYSEADIQRLRLMARATDMGHSIREIAQFSLERLREMVEKEAFALEEAEAASRMPADAENEWLARAKNAVADMDARGLERTLQEADRALGISLLLETVISPLLVWAGEAWGRGILHVSQEHLLSATLRHFLATLRRANSLPASAPSLVLATLPGQQHELGALMAAVAAAQEGWRDVYLGPCLPAAEIAHAAIETASRAVALSLVYPDDDPAVDAELLALRALLPESIAIVAGGRAALAYRPTLDKIGAFMAGTLAAFRTALTRIRRLEPSAKGVMGGRNSPNPH